MDGDPVSIPAFVCTILTGLLCMGMPFVMYKINYDYIFVPNNSTNIDENHRFVYSILVAIPQLIGFWIIYILVCCYSLCICLILRNIIMRFNKTLSESTSNKRTKSVDNERTSLLQEMIIQ
jgi:hypothetical protein